MCFLNVIKEYDLLKFIRFRISGNMEKSCLEEKMKIILNRKLRILLEEKYIISLESFKKLFK